ncbi:putative low molecular weight protein-tyrosine-phosphatase slr0328 [Benincasa hispida]|uniref:putative low molecular weight protein-tyrosine-phosphatase slr0328 n=1 Tax=Benincasa hispida TaxID=102211 RepID=UPI001901B3D8|nr:putative low molecular weight protein-tyrosine-phosphatase slr0328 [Benincasa hispida]
MRALQLQLRIDANFVKPFCHLCLASSLNPSPLLVFQPIKYPHLQKFKPSLSSRRAHFSTPFVASSMADSSLSRSSETETKPFSVLFVCLGNICRSPAAEGVFRNLVTKKGLDSKFIIDSAGTIGYHEGNEADPRMRAASKRRGIPITSISRPIQPSDFVNFDLILAMDKQNREDILGAFERWRTKNGLPFDSHKKVKLMCSYCKKHDESEVPDPYYGGQQGFEKVLDLLEDACESLLESILTENKHISD